LLVEHLTKQKLGAYTDIPMLQQDLDDWMKYYNHDRTHQGKMCCGRTPIVTLEDGKRIWQEKKSG